MSRRTKLLLLLGTPSVAIVGYGLNHRMKHRPNMKPYEKVADLANLTVIVTGASSGVGLEAARQLAALGCNVVMAGRQHGKAGRLTEAYESVRQTLLDKHGSAGRNVKCVEVDLCDLRSVDAFCRQVAEQCPQGVHVLINNAGCMERTPQATADDMDRTLQVNFAAPYLIAERLMPILEAAAKSSGRQSRIINVNSRLHLLSPLTTQDILSVGDKRSSIPHARDTSPGDAKADGATQPAQAAPGGTDGTASPPTGSSASADGQAKTDTDTADIAQTTWHPQAAYANAKLLLLMYSQAIAQHAQGGGTGGAGGASDPGVRVSCNSVTPGLVHTNLFREYPLAFRILTFPLRALFLRSASEGAQTLVYAATARELEGISGRFIEDTQEVDMAPAATDPEKIKCALECAHRLTGVRSRFAA